MNKNFAKVETRVIHDLFGRFATIASNWIASSWAFAAAGLIVVGWAACGPLFNFSPKWEQSINTGTGLATLFIVFLIQNMQNRDSRAINLKLNELILAIDKARNHMIDIERLTDFELDEMQSNYEKIKSAWSARQARQPAERGES
jgi:low affinity Fe/Cu permease